MHCDLVYREQEVKVEIFFLKIWLHRISGVHANVHALLKNTDGKR